MISAAITKYWGSFLRARASLARTRITRHTWRARPKAQLFHRDQGSLFVDENDVVWNKRADYFFQSESTAILGHLTMQSYSLGYLSRFTQLAWNKKKERLSFLTPPPLWIEFPGDFFAGFWQAPSLFDHRRLLIYGPCVYSFCKCKVISVEMVRIPSEESTRCIIFICYRVTQTHPTPHSTK